MLKFNPLNMLKRHILPALLLCGGVLTACEEDTATVGSSVIPGYDNISTSMDVYPVVSRTIESGPVLANTSDCYLGSVVDPETHATTTSSFLAQFHLRENMTMPLKEKMVVDDSGEVIADSCKLTLYFHNYYGDSLTTMKVQVQELNPAHGLEEGEEYYTTLDPSEYVSDNPAVDITQTYAVRDLTKTVSTAAGVYRTVEIALPVDYATQIIRAYYDHPEYFKNSYTFVHHVCPGFYVKSAGGVGSMLNVKLSSLDLYFRYHHTNAAGSDSIYNGFQRMAATEEVIQTSISTNRIPASMLDESNDYTYVKSPAGLYTELTLPMDLIVGGEHYTDSINQVRLAIGRYHNTTDSPYPLAPPPSLLLLPKAEVQQFFLDKRVGDGWTSFITDFSASDNRYIFANIGPYVSHLRSLRDDEAGVKPTDTDSERQAKYDAWEAANPDWNKVVLVPVNADYNEVTDGYTNTTTKTLLRVQNQLGLYSAKLQGGPSGNDLKVEVVYSRFAPF